MRVLSAALLASLALGACNSWLSAQSLPLEWDWLSVMRRKAERGDAVAQFMLGNLYEKGSRQVPKDPEEAGKWYRRSFLCFRLLSEEGDPLAQYWLGGLYNNGTGVVANPEAALRWFVRAAEQGDAHAQATLGRIFRDGDGAPQDREKALHWYRLAAEQGHDNAMYALGRLYGEGPRRDYVEAYKWIHLSFKVSKHRRFARKHLRPLSTKMTSGEVAEAKRLARQWNRDWKQRWKRDWKRKERQRSRRLLNSMRCEW